MDHPHSGGALDGGTPENQGPVEAQYQHLWFSLARSPWSSLVLVPADQGGSADEVARRLAEIGKQLSSSPVTAITVKSLEYGTALALADLPGFVDRARQAAAAEGWSAIEMPASTLDPSGPAGDAPAEGATVDATRNDEALERIRPPDESGMTVSSGARLIISIPPVVTQPLGLATAHNADLVVVCVEVGRTRLAGARRTLDLIGRERVAGCFLIH